MATGASDRRWPSALPALVEREDACELRAGLLVDQVHVAEIPARPSGGAGAGSSGRPTGSRSGRSWSFTVPSLRRSDARLLAHEGEAQLRGRRRGTADVLVVQVAVERRAADLGVARAVVLHLDPGLGGLVEQREAEVGDAFEHGHQASFELAPEGLLLAVLIGRVRQGRVVDDAETGETPPLVSAAIIGSPLSVMKARGRPRLRKAWPEPVDEVLRGPARYHWAWQHKREWSSRMQAHTGDAHRPARAAPAASAGVEVRVPELLDVLDLPAADLAGLQAVQGEVGAGARRGPAAHAADEVARLHVAHERRAGGQRPRARAPCRRARPGCRSAVASSSRCGRGTGPRVPGAAARSCAAGRRGPCARGGRARPRGRAAPCGRG